MANSDEHKLSRREAFLALWRRRERDGGVRAAALVVAPVEHVDAPPRVAVIQGRACLVQKSLMCSVCAERCPVPGAILRERGLPRVVPDVCTGCGVCHDVCPAPRNAVLMLERRPVPRSGGA